MSISKINFFDPGIWQKGALLREIERNLAEADDLLASGRWETALPSRVFDRLADLLAGGKGRSVASFDPAGYLSEVGVPQSLTAGRTNSEMLRAFHLVNVYRPDPRYFPFSKKTGARIQKIFLTLSRIWSDMIQQKP